MNPFRFFSSFRRSDAALNEEIRAHLAMAARDHASQEMPAPGAEQAARREFGNVTHVKEVTRDMWAGAAFERLAQDLKYAVRSLARVPTFTVIAVLTLALGIGANTAIFSVVNGVILTPLPYPHPERLVAISSQFPVMHLDHFPVDQGELVDFRERNQSFDDVAGFVVGAVNIGAEGQPTRVASATASPGIFHTFGVPPEFGRGFTDAETLPNAAAVAVLSHELWVSTFGGQQSILGQKIGVDGVQTMIVGIMPAGFDVRDQGVKIWLPLTFNPAQLNQARGGHFLQMVGRLKPAVTLASARSELQRLLTQWPAADGSTLGKNGLQTIHTPNNTKCAAAVPGSCHYLRFDDLQADTVGNIGAALWVLQAAVLLVLLIACANMANLLLVRAESRHKELALRAALGAGRWRLLRQFIAESVVLSLLGGALGIALARWGVRALILANAGSIPRANAVSLDGRVLAFTLVLSLGTGLFFGLAPLLQLRAAGLSTTLRGTEARSTGSAARNRVRGGLVAAEMALAVMLVIGAGLLMRSFRNLMHVDSGFDRSSLTTFNLVLPAQQYADSTKRVALFDNVTSQLQDLPGVKAAAAMSGLPPRRQILANDTQFENFVVGPNSPAQNVDYWQWATPNYLTTMGIPLVAGRGFGPADGPASPPVVLINEALAKRFYPNQDPLGHRVKPGGAKEWFTIVGIVKDVKQAGLDSQTGTELYLDYAQSPLYLGFAPRNMYVVVRASLAPVDLAAGIRRTVAGLDPALPVTNLRTMDDVFSAAVSRPHFIVELLGIFAAIALALAALGTYGVLSYSVAERRRELGIRMALGQNKQGVLVNVLGRGMTLAAIGLGMGLAGAVGVTRLARALLFGVQPTDPATFAGVTAFMLVVALVACIVPAWRATRVNPMVALRGE